MHKKILSLVLVFSMLVNPFASYAVNDESNIIESSTTNAVELVNEDSENIENKEETNDVKSQNSDNDENKETSNSSNQANEINETNPTNEIVSDSELNTLENDKIENTQNEEPKQNEESEIKNDQNEKIKNDNVNSDTTSDNPTSKENLDVENKVNETDATNSEEEIEYPTSLNFTDEENGISINVKSDSVENLNHAVKVVAVRVEKERENQYKDVLSNENTVSEDSQDEEVVIPTVEKVYVYNISLFDQNNQEVEPTGEISVSFTIDELKDTLTDEKTLTVYHNTDTTLDVDNEENSNVEKTESEESVQIDDKSIDNANSNETKTETETTETTKTPELTTYTTEIKMDSLKEIKSDISDEGTVTISTDSFSEYALVLSGNSSQKEVKLWKNAYMELDKYTQKKDRTINNQSTYDLYLEQGYYDKSIPDIISNPAPAKQYISLIIDQSGSMAINSKIRSTNEAIQQLLQRIVAVNENRIKLAKEGQYTDIDEDGNVEAQMENHLICVQFVVGYNNHTYDRYIDTNGTNVLTENNVNAIYNKIALKNDIEVYKADKAAGITSSADMQAGTRTDLGLARYHELLQTSPDPANAHVILITDGKPTNPPWFTRDIVLPNGTDRSMSSEVSNNALRTARSIKNKGTTIYGVYIGYEAKDELLLAQSTGNIRDVPQGIGIAAVFLSLVSSDYPKNETLGTKTNSTQFDYTYSYEEDSRNKFGQYTYITDELDDMVEAVISMPARIDGVAKKNTTGYASSASYIQDVVSDPFEVTEGEEIKVYKVPRIPKNLGNDGIPTDMDSGGVVSEFRWGNQYYEEGGTTKSEWIEITDEVSISNSNNIIKITGFDYESNAVVNYDKDTRRENPKANARVYKAGDYGYKLVVTVPINAKTTFGGNSIETNNSDSSNFYPSIPNIPDELPPWPENTKLNPSGKEYLEKYPVPKVDLNINYNIVSDNIIVYAPQTAEIRNILTDKNNSLWYQDSTYNDLKTLSDNALINYNNIVKEQDDIESELNKLAESDPKRNELEAEATELDSKTAEALEKYKDAQKKLNKVANYTPNGINNAFVNISYELKDPDGQTLATMTIPHGMAYTLDKDGNGNIDWNITGGENAILMKSGTYTIQATISPVDTNRAPNGHVHVDGDSSTENIPYLSTEYSPTGSKANGSQNSLTVKKNPTVYLFQLKITTKDTRLVPSQTLDFNQGNETLESKKNPHIVNYEWICTDGKTKSIKANEPGNNPLLSIGDGVSVVNTISEQARQDGLVQTIMGTDSTGKDDCYVPVNVLAFRNVGNLNKSVDTLTQTKQTLTYLTEDDHIWGNTSSVIWVHECDILTDEDCNETEYIDAQKYNSFENASGIGKIRYLIHVQDNPNPDIHKTTSTPTITRGEDILWNVQLINDNETENPHHYASDFSMVDILPYNGDGRIDPNTNNENSQFSGELQYKQIKIDLSKSPTTLQKIKNGTASFYYTTETAVRNADESQILGTHNKGNINWTKVEFSISNNIATVDVSENAVAIKMTTRLLWNEEIRLDMVANLKSLAQQNVNDRYHNQAITFNGHGGKLSEVVATTVPSVNISGIVWEDSDANGLMSTSEPKVSNIVITLYKPYNPNNGKKCEREINGIKLERAYDANTDSLSPIITGTNGEFSFDDIVSGTYYIVADTIPDQYQITAKQVGKNDINSSKLDSKAEINFVNGNDSKLNNTAWIKEIQVGRTSATNQNIGLKLILGSVEIGKSLNEIYYPSSMSDEEREDYQLVFTFQLRNTANNKIYKQAVRLTNKTYQLKNGKPQVFCKFKDLPLGTYELTEIKEAQYELNNVVSVKQTNNISYDKQSKKATIRITSNEYDYTVYADNKLIKDPPGGDKNGVTNWINVRVPVSMKLTYKGADPISNHTLTKYTFQRSDFDDIIITYDDGSQISLKENSLDFNNVTLSPDTVTNDMNSGKDKIAITAYYSEKGRTVTDSFRVKIDLKPVRKFQITFNANKSTFNDNSDKNVVRFGYDDNKRQNYVITGTYKDYNNGLLKLLGTGFSFKGWNDQVNGMGKNYDGLTALNEFGASSGETLKTLYARWATNVKFNANGGVLSGGSTEEERKLVGRTEGSISYNLKQSMWTGLSATKQNYEFVEWNTSPDGTGTSIRNYGEVKNEVTFYAIYYQSDYTYTGSVQTFRAPVNGIYEVQLWGARGGNDDTDHKWGNGNDGYGGHGAYVKGRIHLTAGQELYVYVGQPGADNTTGTGAGWNGGGNPGSRGWSGSGGGATSISTVNGNWNDYEVLNNRIAVAAGGGGAGVNCHDGGYAGALVGGNGVKSKEKTKQGYGGTQTEAGLKGGFGYGGTAQPDGGGGGGGWYGGGAGDYDTGGGGGSSYISGYNGCEIRNWNFVFTETSMIPGNAMMPTPNKDKTYELGHDGQCYAYITLLSSDNN